EIHFIPANIPGVADHLKGKLQAGLSLKRCPQDFVTSDDLAGRCFQLSDVERTFNRYHALRSERRTRLGLRLCPDPLLLLRQAEAGNCVRAHAADDLPTDVYSFSPP